MDYGGHKKIPREATGEEPGLRWMDPIHTPARRAGKVTVEDLQCLESTRVDGREQKG